MYLDATNHVLLPMDFFFFFFFGGGGGGGVLLIYLHKAIAISYYNTDILRSSSILW